MHPPSNISIQTEIVLAMTDFEALGEGPLSMAKIQALMYLPAIADRYLREFAPEETIVLPIIQKKIAFIKAATEISDIYEILQPPKVQRIGYEVCAVGRYAIPEEELFLWAQLIPNTQLIEPAMERYRKLFREIFPDEAKKIGI